MCAIFIPHKRSILLEAEQSDPHQHFLQENKSKTKKAFQID
jgi:hypothetical protein